jgi:hypothetical protein
MILKDTTCLSDALGYYGFKEIDKGDNKICLERQM